MNLGSKIITGVVLGGLVAFGLYAYRQSKLLQSICYDLLTMTYLGTQNGITTISSVLRFSNYADYPIKIKKYNINVSVDGVVVGTLNQTINQTIPAKGQKDVEFIAQGNFNQAFSVGLATIIEELVDGTSSLLSIKGTASISTGIVSVDNYPISYSTTTRELLDSVQKESENCPIIT